MNYIKSTEINPASGVVLTKPRQREEIGTIEEIGSGVEDAIKALRDFVFLLSENPNFATIMGQGRLPPGVKIAPLPEKLPDPAVIRARPRRRGAPPYPFLKRDTFNED
jgi:hypothetical protein